MARKRATLTDLLNDLTFKINYDKLKLLALNRFEMTGLPDGIEERHIAHLLFSKGAAIFFRDPEMSYMCLQADPGSGMNVNGDPLGWWATGYNYHKYYDADDCVIIKNNKLMIPTEQFVMYYANKLTEADRTMDVNVKACKTPFIFACDDKDVLSFKQIFAKVDGNEPAIYADRGLNLDSFQVFKTGVTFLGNDIQKYRHTIENESLTFLGFNNVAVEKKERLITDEAEANNELIDSFLQIQLSSIEDAFNQINKKYDLNMAVKLRESFQHGVEKNVEKSAETGVTGNA